MIGERTDAAADVFMELLMPETAEVLAFYDHYNWNEYAAVTRNQYGKGTASYIGTKVDEITLNQLLVDFLKQAEVELPEEKFPIIVRKGKNDFGKMVRYYLNYSESEKCVKYRYISGKEILTGDNIENDTILQIEPWNLKIVEEQ